MSETQQRQKHPRLLLNIVLIILETFSHLFSPTMVFFACRRKSLSQIKSQSVLIATCHFSTSMCNLRKRFVI